MWRWGQFSNTVQYYYSPSHTQKRSKRKSLKSKRAFLFLWTKYSRGQEVVHKHWYLCSLQWWLGLISIPNPINLFSSIDIDFQSSKVSLICVMVALGWWIMLEGVIKRRTKSDYTTNFHYLGPILQSLTERECMIEVWHFTVGITKGLFFGLRNY